MAPRVRRGLLATEAGLARVPVTVALTGRQIADRAIARLRAEPTGGYRWKEKAEWGRRLAQGKPDDRGRRLWTDAGRADARYVARLATRAYRGGPETDGWGNPLPAPAWGMVLPSDAQFAHLRGSLARIYDELNGRAR